MLVIIALTLLTLSICYYLMKPLKYWEERRIKYGKPLPLFGNMLPILLRKGTIVDVLQGLYTNYPSERYVGMYQFTTPSLIVKDPELIKTIMVKEFETFPNHRTLIASGVDTVWDNGLFAMNEREKWHQLRSALSPLFTGSKLKNMFVLMKECSDNFITYHKSKGERIEIEVKDAFTRFANDVIATAAFGITCNSLVDPENEFYSRAKEINFLRALRRFSIFINLISPLLSRISRMSIFTEKVRRFFTNLVNDSLELRRSKGIIRPDMLHLLMELQKRNSDFAKVEDECKLEITDDIITSQVMLFFLAGFETTSTLMSYTIYELALNIDIQNRLREEIDNCDGQITYDNLMGMKFLDMVVSESLRKWPPTISLSRQSVLPYTICPENPSETPLFLDKHSIIICPIFSIHRDPKYYPNPEKFDPERFNKENSIRINPYTYIPFGVGPRNCIGSRFALTEGKLMIAEIVKNYNIFPTSKTLNPIVFSRSSFSPIPDGGIWVGLQKRSID